MSKKLIAACIQTNAVTDIETNLQRIEPLLRTARDKGTEFIALPENVCLITQNRDHLFASSPEENKHPGYVFFSRMAKETGAWILAGSMGVHIGHDRLANRSYLFNPEGKPVAHYDKIHMFDADIGLNESYRESAKFRGGDRAVIADTPWGKIGLTICYDIRFPHLYRALAKANASIITVPAAFVMKTGRMHWHVLLRARAIETGCYVVAPAQCGTHDGGRQTYGHSLIIDPTGAVIAEASDTQPGIVMAELDMDKVVEARRMVPSVQHDCEFERPC